MGKRDTSTPVAVLERPAAPNPGRATPGTAPPPLPAEITALVEETRRDEIASLALFDKLAETGALTGDERTFLRQRVAPADVRSQNTFDRWLLKQAARMKAIRGWQRACGTPAERQAAAERAEQARARQADLSPDIQRRITELQAELAALADATRVAEEDVQRREAAVESLQLETRLPAFIRQSVRVLGQSIREATVEAMNARNRVAALEHILGLDPRDGQQLAEIKGWCALTYTPAGHLLETCWPYADGHYTPGECNPRRFVAAEWDAYLPTLQREIAELQATVEKLGDPSAGIAGELAQLRQYWIPK